MANWWDSAPIVEEGSDDWWSAAPVVDEMQSPEMTAGLESLGALSAPEVQNTVSGVAGQVGAGSQEGIAAMLGMPVDALASAASGVGELTGLWGPIENPVGGSASISAALEPFRAGIPEPATNAERFARRVGEEVGAGAAGAPLALASAAGRASPVAAALVEGASSLGAGLGAATANQYAPDSVVAEIAGALAGGLPAGMAASRALGLEGAPAVMAEGTMESQKRRAADAYDIVRNDQTVLGPEAATELELGLIQRAIDSGIDPDLTPNAAALERGMARRINPNMSVEDVEDLRRIVGGGISNTASDSDKRVAMAMKDEITAYLDNLNTPATEALREGRDATRRYKAAELVGNATTKAERRAASSGTGGNEINAIRQNLRGLLDNPNKARSFTASEREAMEAIVRGDTGQNALRRLSRIAPSTGAIAPYLGLGGYAVAGPAMLPVLGAAELAKVAGERSTQKSVDALVRSLLGERVMATSQDSINPVIAALLGLRATNYGDQ